MALEQSHDLGVDLPIALEDAEDDRLARSVAPAFSLDVAGHKEGFIDFDLPCEWGLLLVTFSLFSSPAGRL